MSRRIGLIGLAAAAATGFRGVLFNLCATMDRYAQRAGPSWRRLPARGFPSTRPASSDCKERR